MRANSGSHSDTGAGSSSAVAQRRAHDAGILHDLVLKQADRHEGLSLRRRRCRIEGIALRFDGATGARVVPVSVTLRDDAPDADRTSGLDQIVRASGAQLIRKAKRLIEILVIGDPGKRGHFMHDAFGCRGFNGAKNDASVEGVRHDRVRTGVAKHGDAIRFARHGGDLVPLGHEQWHEALPDCSGGTGDKYPHGSLP